MKNITRYTSLTLLLTNLFIYTLALVNLAVMFCSVPARHVEQPKHTYAQKSLYKGKHTHTVHFLHHHSEYLREIEMLTLILKAVA